MRESYGRSLFITPTSFEGADPDFIQEGDGRNFLGDRSPGTGRPSRDRQALIGTLAHRILYTWNFQADPEKLPALVTEVCHAGIPDEWKNETPNFINELRDMFNGFVRTAPFAILRQAEILGREVPIMVPWKREGEKVGWNKPSSAVLRGVVDIVYRWKHHIWVADYKTAIVKPDEEDWVVAKYRAQAIAYQDALREIFKDTTIRAQLIFLRQGFSKDLG